VALADPGAALARRLDHPLDFPPLERAVVPGDKVVIALDGSLPQPACLVEPIVERLLQARVEPSDITLLSQAPSDSLGNLNGHGAVDPRSKLVGSLQESVRWERFQCDTDTMSYLANTAAGHRVYLHRRLVDADVIVPVACLRCDPLLGYRGPNSVVYPGFADRDARWRMDKLTLAAQSQPIASAGEPAGAQHAHETDEVAWLLGIQFAVGVVPAQDDAIAHVLAGESRSVFEQGRHRAVATWRFSLPRRCDLVVAGIGSADGAEGIAAALNAAQRVVKRGGRILLLCDVDGRPGVGLQAVAAADEPRHALTRLADEPPADALAAHRIAQAVDWARVYLLSRLEPDLVEDLFMVPLESLSEAGRLVARAESLVVLNEAQQVLTVLEAEQGP
jgi:nickel-dependent lactate racemase